MRVFVFVLDIVTVPAAMDAGTLVISCKKITGFVEVSVDTLAGSRLELS